MALILVANLPKLSRPGRAPSADRFGATMSQATAAPMSATGSGFAAICRPRLRTNSAPPFSLAKLMTSSITSPGLSRVRSTFSVSSISLRVRSTSFLSCSVVAMPPPEIGLDDSRVALHLTLRHRSILAQLIDRLLRDQGPCFQPAQANRQHNEADEQKTAAHEECRSPQRPAGCGWNAVNTGHHENHEG